MCICEAERIIDPIPYLCPMTPLTTRGGGGGGSSDQVFLFLRLPTAKNRSFAPRFPLNHSFRSASQPRPPRELDRSASRSALRPFGPRGSMKLDLPSLEGPRISRPKGHDLIENDNFVSPRAGVQVAARSSCHRQRAWRDGVPPPSQTLPLFTLSHLVCEGPRGGKKRPKACGLPFKHTRISHGNALFDRLFGWGVFRTAPIESEWPKMLFLAQGASQDLVVHSLVDPDPSPGVEALNSEANAR